MPDTPPRHRQWLMQYFLIVVISTVAGFVAFEVYARLITNRQHWELAQSFLDRVNRSAFTDFHPYVGLIEEPYSGRYPFSQVPGDTAATIAKPPATFRIIILGGSVAQWAGLDKQNDELVLSSRFLPAGAWWHTCERGLAALVPNDLSGVRFEILPAGIMGAVTTNEAIKLLTADLLEWQPDMILALDGFNDVNTSILAGRPPGIDLWVPFMRLRLEHPLAYGLYQAFSWSAGARLLFKAYAEGHLAKSLSHPSPEAVADRMVKTYAFIRAIARGADASFVIALQPTSFMHSSAPNNQWQADQIATAKMQRSFEVLADKVSTWAGTARVPFHSYYDLFEDHRQLLFFDQVHFNSEGYEVLCQRLANDLGPEIWAQIRRVAAARRPPPR